MSILHMVPDSSSPCEVWEGHRTPPSMLDRMTLIMDCFTAQAARLTLEEVSRTTGLPRSTTHRILVDLVRLGWLRQIPHGYALGSRTMAFSGGESGHGRLREATAESLHDLALRTGMVVHLAVLADSEIVYLDKVGGRLATQVPSRVGGHAPAHSTALGKSMLAWLTPEEVDARIGPAIGRVTTRTISRLPTLHQELRRIRERKGLAFERGECFPEVACVAVAVRSLEGPVASISLCGNRGVPLERVAPLVAHAVRQASARLFPEVEAEEASQGEGGQHAGEWTTEALDSWLSVGSGTDWM